MQTTSSLLVRGVVRFALSMTASVAFAVQVPSDILVVADVTAAGKAAPPASPEHPVHYEALWAGFQELGAVVAGERQPSVEAAKQELTAALRRIGYRPAGPGTPAPTILICFAWGTLNPDTLTTPGSGVEGQDESVSFNSAQMLGFLGAHKVSKLSDYSQERERVLAAAREDHYYLAVAAYDLESVRQRKRKLLWMTRTATDSLRIWLPDVLPDLVAGSAPFFGKDSDLPVWIDPANLRKSSVKLGPLEVKDYLPDGNNAPRPGGPGKEGKP